MTPGKDVKILIVSCIPHHYAATSSPSSSNNNLSSLDDIILANQLVGDQPTSIKKLHVYSNLDVTMQCWDQPRLLSVRSTETLNLPTGFFLLTLRLTILEATCSASITVSFVALATSTLLTRSSTSFNLQQMFQKYNTNAKFQNSISN